MLRRVFFSGGGCAVWTLSLSLLSENHQNFAKIAKNIIFGRAQFLTFQQIIKTTLFFDEKSKAGLGFEIGQPQRKRQCRPTLQSMANPAVVPSLVAVIIIVHADREDHCCR